MRRVLPLAGAAAAVAGLLVAVWPGGGGTRAAVSASLTPRAPLFGDPVVARVEAPPGTRVEAAFRPFVVRSVARRGGSTSYTLECLTAACVPGASGLRTIRLPPAIVRLPGRNPVSLSWPALRIGSRLSPGELEHPSFWADLTAPAGTAGLDPAALGWSLTALAAALLLAAGAWVARRLRPRRRTLRLVPGPDRTPLERALEAVDESLHEPAERRRAALDRLAAVLDDDLLARRVRRLAWSEQIPEPAAIRLVAHQARERSA